MSAPPPRDGRRALRDFAPVAAVLALCPIAAAFAPGPAAPIARIESLVDAERSLGLFFEPALHRWVAAHPPLMGAANFAYVGFHLPVMLGILVWVWLKRPAAFALVRNTFIAAQALITAGYVLAPTAPPRMVAAFGYDMPTVPGVTGLERLAISPYAAMPSGHTAFALIGAATVFTLARHRAVRWAALLYPPIVLTEIYATGNHIWLDSLAGAAAAVAGFAIARAIERRPGGRRVAPEPVGELV